MNTNSQTIKTNVMIYDPELMKHTPVEMEVEVLFVNRDSGRMLIYWVDELTGGSCFKIVKL